MTNNRCTTSKSFFKHLTDIQKGRLEEMGKSGYFTQVEMATELKCNLIVVTGDKWYLIEHITIAI